MAAQNIESNVEQLSHQLTALKAEQAADRKAFSTWALSVGAGHLVVSLSFWLGIALADFKGNTQLMLIIAMPALVLFTTGVSVLASLAGTRLRAYRLTSAAA